VTHSLSVNDHCMANAHRSRITLELEAEADPIRGLIEQPDGSRKPFWGWLELMEDLRRVAADKRVPTSQPRRAPGRLASPARPARQRQPHRSTGEQS
jgi:hypothetical protein